MSRSWWLRAALLIILILGSCYALMPTVVEMIMYPENKDKVVEDDVVQRDPPLPEWYNRLDGLGSWAKAKTLALGLDLQGGVMMRYSVDIDSALDDKIGASAANIRSMLGTMGYESTYKLDRNKHQVEFTFPNVKAMDLFTREFLDQNAQLLQKVSVDATTGKMVLGLREGIYKDSEAAAISQAVEIIRERIDGLGVAQPTVRVEAGRNIAVELPGLSSARAEQAEKLISTTAVLTFKLVAPRDEANMLFTELSRKIEPDSGIYIGGGYIRANDQVDAKGRITKSGKDILKEFVHAHEEDIPSGREIDFEKVDERELRYEVKEGEDPSKLPTRWRMRLVRTDMPPLSGENVENAYPASNPDTNMPYVSLKLDHNGGEIFYNITKEHVGEQLAILMDDQLVSDPVIRSEIPGGNVSIEMGRGNRQQTLDEVNNLVVSLRSGALPAPIRQEYKTLVGPSLGMDSIISGVWSLGIGFALVILFMIFYYHVSGIFAAIALALNVLFIMAGMASMGAALTMPGIAGIVLTVGMAVDSNVIIFERIREELRANELPRKAIHQGFDKALWTILDSNITTAIAAVVLMNFGSGPVKGFAVTLLLGIVCTVYTAFFVTRSVFELKVKLNDETMSI